MNELIVSTQEAKGGFYPTPGPLADKLMEGIDWRYCPNVLEPSAGKGDLIRHAMRRMHATYRRGWNWPEVSFDAVEIDPYLRSIFQYDLMGGRLADVNKRISKISDVEKYNPVTRAFGKLRDDEHAEREQLRREADFLKTINTRIIHDDFLTLDTRKSYNLILMNPPFSEGDAHLLKAIEMQRANGGEIRCILNADTLLNTYTKRRQLLSRMLDELDAEVEIVDGAFSHAERPTDVTVAIVKVKIPQQKRESAIFERLRKAAGVDEFEQREVTELAVEEYVERIVTMYNVEVDAGLALLREHQAMKPYLLGDMVLRLTIGSPYGSRGDIHDATVNDFLRDTRRKYWRALFSNPEIVGRLTSNLQEKYRGMVEKLVAYDLTAFNIERIITEMNAEMEQGIQDTIIALFDKLTVAYAHIPEMTKNIHYFNGWKTNKVHKINKKVIMPVNGMFSEYITRGAFDFRTAEETIGDIEKVFEYFDGNMSAPVDLHDVLKTASETGQTKKIPCKFFDVTLYKKGTMHIHFRDQRLVDRFNIYCCATKNWLPPDYGRKRYKDMTADERTVVDGFNGDGVDGSGQKSYDKIVQQPGYYLSPPAVSNQTLAIGAGQD